MEIRYSRFLLKITTLTLILTGQAAWSETPSLDQIQEVEAVIQPEVARVEFDESKIDVGDFEIVPAVGILSIEDFSSNVVINTKFNYHMSEDVFIGFELGRSKGGKSTFEVMVPGSNFLSDEQRVLTYYLFNIGYNMLPGEAYLTDKVTYNNALYLTGGMGSVEFAGDTRLAVTVGVGYRLMMFNLSSLYVEMRDHTFNLDVTGVSKLTNNFEMTLGYSFYF
ncbi:MAG: outer membrane beta-barrel domain-containing protein [Gammaproteobacteria bacterium]|nr:outer membrane beta-barrel domain-containing protein [Gammaproteobacteria bacterium]